MVINIVPMASVLLSLCFWEWFFLSPLGLEFSTFEHIVLGCVGEVGISAAFVTLTLVGLTSELFTLLVQIM